MEMLTLGSASDQDFPPLGPEEQNNNKSRHVMLTPF